MINRRRWLRGSGNRAASKVPCCMCDSLPNTSLFSGPRLPRSAVPPETCAAVLALSRNCACNLLPRRTTPLPLLYPTSHVPATMPRDAYRKALSRLQSKALTRWRVKALVTSVTRLPVPTSHLPLHSEAGGPVDGAGAAALPTQCASP